MPEEALDQGRVTAPSQAVIDLRDKRLAALQESLYNRDDSVRPTQEPKFFLDETGRPRLSTDEKGFFGLTGTRLKRQALEVFVGDPDLKDILLFDFATTAAGFSNQNDLDRIALLDEQDGMFYNHKEEQYQDGETITPDTLLDYLSPLKLQALQESGIPLDILPDLSVEDGQTYLKRSLLQVRLDNEIEGNIDGMLDRYGSTALAFGSQLIDPSLIAAPGVGIAAKKLGTAALRQVAKNQSKHWAIKAAAGTASRFKRNGSVVGTLIDNKFTQSHAAGFIGVDTALTSAGFDLYTQSKENEVYETYFDETGEMWWSPTRSLLAGSIGLFLGYGISKLFGVDNAHLEGKRRMEEVLDAVAPDVDPVTKQEILSIWEPSIAKLRAVVDADGDVTNKEVYVQVVNDMYESLLPLYDNADNLIDGMKPSEYLKGRIDEVLESQSTLVRTVSQEEVDAVNATLDDLGSRSDDLFDERADLRVEISQLKRDIANGNEDSAFYLKDEVKYLENRLAEVENGIAEIGELERGVHRQIEQLNSRQQLANQAKLDGITPVQVHANAAKMILDFLMERPTFKELDEFLSADSGPFARGPVERRKALKKIRKEREALETKLEQLKANPDKVNEHRQTQNVLEVEMELRSLDIEAEVNYNRRIHPEVKDTKYRRALDLKQEASSLWRDVAEETDPEVRKGKFTSITNLIDESRDLIDQVRTETINRVGVTDTQQDRLAREFDADILGAKITPVTEQTRNNARRILEAHTIETGIVDQPLRNRTIINRMIYNSFFNNISGITTSRPDLEAIARESPEVYSLLELLADISLTSRSHRNKDKFVGTIDSSRRRFDRQMSRRVAGPLQKMFKDTKKNKQDINERLIQAYIVAYGGKSNDELATELGNGMAKIFQDMETDGISVGKLRNTEGRYLHAQLIHDLDKAPEGKELIISKYHQRLKEMYDPRNKKGGTSRAVMAESQIIAEAPEGGWRLNGARFVDDVEELTYTNPKTLEKTTVKDLSQVFDEAQLTRFLNINNLQFIEINIDGKFVNALDAYTNNFDTALRKEAENALSNRNNAEVEVTRSSGSQDFQDITRRRQENATYQRQIPLDIIFSEDVLRSGIVELNPILNLRHYWASFGYDIAEQKKVQELLGENGVTLEDYLDFALAKHKARRKELGKKAYTDSKYRTLKQMVMQSRDQLAGRHLSTSEEGSFLTGVLQAINQITSIPVNARVGLMMPMTELVTPALIHVMSSKQKVHALLSMLKSFSESLNRADRTAFGKTVHDIQLTQRVLVDNGLYGDEVALDYWERLLAPWRRVKKAAFNDGEAATFRGSSRLSNTLVATTEALSETTRSTSGELVWTRIGQTMFAKYHARMVGDNLTKLELAATELSKLPVNPTTKQLKGIARKSGLRLEDMQDYIQNGVITKTGLEIHFLKELRNAGARDFGDIDNVYRIIDQNFTGARKAVVKEQWERVVDTISNKVDRDVTLPGIFDRPVHQSNSIVSMISRYLSFARGFRAGKMQNITNSGIGIAASGLMAYYGSELVNRSLISMWMDGSSYEEVKGKWLENPAEMTVYSLSSLPVLGGGNQIATSFIQSLISDRPPEVSLAPSLQIFNGQLRSTYRALFDDDASEYDERRALMNLPFVNNALSQIILDMYLDQGEGTKPFGP